MKLLVAIAFFLVPHASCAADEPEAVYAKFHRAVMAGDLEEMLKYGPAARRAEMRGASASTREAALKMAQFMMPRAFTLERKNVLANGRGATLIVSGPAPGEGQKPATMYGIVRMLMENGEWKVDDAGWSNDKPAILAMPKPGAAPAIPEKAVPKVAAKGAPVSGSVPTATPGRKLGPAKPDCVYKPVMTAEDIANCK